MTHYLSPAAGNPHSGPTAPRSLTRSPAPPLPQNLIAVLILIINTGLMLYFVAFLFRRVWPPLKRWLRPSSRKSSAAPDDAASAVTVELPPEAAAPPARSVWARLLPGLTRRRAGGEGRAVRGPGELGPSASGKELHSGGTVLGSPVMAALHSLQEEGPVERSPAHAASAGVEGTVSNGAVFAEDGGERISPVRPRAVQRR